MQNFKHISRVDIGTTSYEIAVEWIPVELTGG